MAKRIGCVIAVFLLCVLGMNTASASKGTEISVQYTHVYQIQVSLSIDSGVAVCSGRAASRIANGNTKASLTLQKREIGTTSWKSVCTWSEIASGKKTAILYEKRNVNSGYEYRLKMKCTVSDSEGVILETATKYSSIRTVE